jgi:hypothetical protein
LEIRRAEGSAGGGEPDLADFAAFAGAHALVHGVVLGVDGEKSDVTAASRGGKDFSGGDHGFFVGEADSLAGFDGCVGGFESGDADDGGDDEVGFGEGGGGDRAFGAPDDFNLREAFAAETGVKVGGELFCSEGDEAGTPAEALLEGDVEIAAGGERDDGEAVGIALDDAQSALTDGAGRSQDGNVLQVKMIFTHQQFGQKVCCAN